MNYDLLYIVKIIQDKGFNLDKIIELMKRQGFRKTSECSYFGKQGIMYADACYIRENVQTNDIIKLHEEYNYTPKEKDFEMSYKESLTFIGRNSTNFKKIPYDELKQKYIFKVNR